MKRAVLSAEQCRHFQEQGVLYLPGIVPEKQLLPVQKKIYAALKNQKIWAGGRFLSATVRELPPFQQVTHLGQVVKVPELYQALQVPFTATALSALSPQAFTASPDAQLLVSLPQSSSWSLAALPWHVDIAKSQSQNLPGIQVFVLLDTLIAQGGATLALKGSHLLTVTQRQRLYGVLKTDCRPEMQWENHKLSVLEMTGRIGDVYFMDMRVLHAPSLNARSSVRLMATQRYFCR